MFAIASAKSADRDGFALTRLEDSPKNFNQFAFVCWSSESPEQFLGETMSPLLDVGSETKFDS
jgi:hypothetical protein